MSIDRVALTTELNGLVNKLDSTGIAAPSDTRRIAEIADALATPGRVNYSNLIMLYSSSPNSVGNIVGAARKVLDYETRPLGSDPNKRAIRR